jgi:hypothetical protein
MGVSLKTEQRRSHSAVSGFRPWVRRAEGHRGTRHLKPCMEVPVKPRRPPSLPLICEVFPDHSSFSVLRETPMASAIYFKKLSCYEIPLFEYENPPRAVSPAGFLSSKGLGFMQPC